MLNTDKQIEAVNIEVINSIHMKQQNLYWHKKKYNEM